MARSVYKWPPVDAVATMWSTRQPVNRSQSFFTGASITSSAERKRKVAHVEVPGIGDLGGSINAGYCEVLKEFLEGGKNLVRLTSMPVNWFFEYQKAGDRVNYDFENTLRNVRQSPDRDYFWVSERKFNVTLGTDGSWAIATVSGLPPNTIVARPGEIVTSFSSTNETSSTKVVRPAKSDTSGVAIVYLLEALAYDHLIQLNSTESAVFEVDGALPEAIQPYEGNWSYQWDFRQVFPDEVGGFIEVDPWN